MNRTGTSDGERRPSILLVDPCQTVPDDLVELLERNTGHPLITATSIETARARLASNPVDCLLLDIDHMPDDGRQFVAVARTVAPEAPLIVLTTQGPEILPEDVMSQVTTIVEQANDPDNWAFLVEKIRSARREFTPKQNDYEQYRMLVESARDGLYRLDANGDVVYTNESWAEMLGYTRGEMLGIHASRAMADGELERGQRLIQRVMGAEDRESDTMDMEMVTRDGEDIVVSICFVVLTTEDGAYDGIVGVARDVTERRARERELQRKNERLEQFAAMVSHDLRNPLTTAEGYLELAREEGEDEALDRVEESLDRMERIIGDMLWLAQKGREVGTTERVELRSRMLDAWRTVAGEGGAATLDIPDENRGWILVDEDRLRQLLENLFRNAIDHGGADVTVRVEWLEDGFVVVDDGPGIPLEDREAVFERGYSTARDGTGFGLAIVEEIVDAHGWDITVREGDPGGARFEITGVDVERAGT